MKSPWPILVILGLVLKIAPALAKPGYEPETYTKEEEESTYKSTYEQVSNAIVLSTKMPILLTYFIQTYKPSPTYKYTTEKYYEGQTVESEYKKPESFQEFEGKEIEPKNPKYYEEKEKPYKPIELEPAPKVN